jgi:uncharacterized protein (TIGR02001 family)
MVRALAIAILGIVPAAAGAQQLDSATPPAPSTTARPEAAKESGSSFDVNIGASLTSDYNYRGYTLSDHRPSASTNIEATYQIFFAGLNAASVQMPMLSQFQMTNYAGIRPKFGSLTVETGVAYFSYPGSTIDIAYPEFYVAPSYALTPKLTVGASAYYAPDYSRTGAWENYDSINAKYTFDSGLSVSGELGRQSFGTTRATPLVAAYKLPDYTYWNVGFSYTYKVLTFDLRYFATTLSKQSCNLITGTAPPGAGSNGCEPAIIGTLSWSTDLSGLK